MTKEEKKKYDKEYRKNNKAKIKKAKDQYYVDNTKRLKKKRAKNKKIKKKYNEQYRLDHSEDIKKNNDAYYMKNLEEKKEYARQHYEDNKEHYKSKNKTYRENNKETIKKRQKEWYDSNTDKVKNEKLLKAYGITLEQYNEMFNKQEGKCAICGINQNELKYALYVDHNHTTKKIRGLLCHKCNTILGYANDKMEILTQAIEYLKINM